MLICVIGVSLLAGLKIKSYTHLYEQHQVMKNILVIIILSSLLFSCATPQYIHDPASAERHKKIQGNRGCNTAGCISMALVSILFSAITGSEGDFDTGEKEYKHIVLENTSADTLFVNMLTDHVLDGNMYSDIMDIRIPPATKCRLLLPKDAVYNVYFSNTPEPDDDEMIEFDTGKKKKLLLHAGMIRIQPGEPEQEELK